MKALKLSGLLALVIMCSSCDLHNFLGDLFGSHEPQFVVYNIGLRFQDASGNDLVRGIGLSEWCCPTNIPEDQAQSGSVKDSLFTLDIIVSEPCYSVITAHRYGVIPDVPHYDLEMESYNGYNYLATYFSLFVSDCPNMKMVTYKLKCPYVFGDDTIHEFVAYWDIPPVHNNMFTYAKCTRIEFEGRVITQIDYPEKDNMHTSIATIIWEGRKNNE